MECRHVIRLHSQEDEVAMDVTDRHLAVKHVAKGDRIAAGRLHAHHDGSLT